MDGKESIQPNRKPCGRWRWLAWTAAAIIAWTATAIVTLVVFWMIWYVIAFSIARAAYENEYKRISKTMKSLRERRPQNVSPKEWEATIDWVGGTAQCNIFFSEEHTSFQSMKRFGDRLEDKMKHEIDSSMLDWIEDQFEQTGPHGKQYIRRFGPGVREYIQAIRRGPDHK